MKHVSKIFFSSIFLILLFAVPAQSQIRLAVMPFQNMDGDAAYDHWCSDISDSLAIEIASADPDEYNYRIVPSDSIRLVLKELNYDPKDPNHMTTMWKAMEILKIERVITGNFNVQAGKLLINAYVYYTELKLAHPKYQVKNLFKTEDQVLSVIPLIHKKLRQAILGN